MGRVSIAIEYSEPELITIIRETIIHSKKKILEDRNTLCKRIWIEKEQCCVV